MVIRQRRAPFFPSATAGAAGRRRTARRAAGLAAALALTLTACGGAGPAGDADVTLDLVVADYGKRTARSSADYWKRVVDAFEKRHPEIAVHMDPVPYNRLDKTVAARVAAGDAPDIAQTGVFAPYVAKGKLYSADETLSIGTQADFVPALARAGEIHHVQYGMPFSASTPRLFYNKKLFKRAGIERPPVSWAGIERAAAALKDAGVQTPYALQTGPEAAEDETLSWLLGNNGGYVGMSGGYTLDSAENTAALTAVRDGLVAPGLTGPKGSALNRTEAYRGFVAGKVGMVLAHPVLIPMAEAAHVPYGTAPFPRRSGGAATSAGLSDWLVAFKQHHHARQIGTFLDFLYGTDNAVHYAGGQGTLPVTVPAAEKMRADAVYRPLWPFVDQLPKVQFQPMATRSWPRVRAALQEKIAGALSRGGDPAAVLAGLQDEADHHAAGVH
ncbi:extracellular solute-binding protein [Streptomyces violens]|uniref:extracellular solute-binding protein n=1 Tax=Streptomyces violens TaxID=66377 RepID=UPI000689F229|nr:extracellular solute-binding protein [Streptomyces violens]